MSSASAKPEVAAALTVTIVNVDTVTFEPSTGTVPVGGVIRFVSGDLKRWEVQLWNATNDDPHPLRLFVPELGGSYMVADPQALPRDVNFDVMTYPGGKTGPADGGRYTITITSNDGATK